jgi:hypothetical protein
MECFKKHGFENQDFCMKGGVDGLMPDSAPPTAGKRWRKNPPKELADKSTRCAAGLALSF